MAAAPSLAGVSADAAQAKHHEIEDRRFFARFQRLQGDFANAWLDFAGLSAILEVSVAAPQRLERFTPTAGSSSDGSSLRRGE